MISNRSLRRPLTLALLLAGCTVLGACGIVTTPNTGTDLQALAACTGSGSMFDHISFDDWPKTYHSTVANVIEAHMDSLKDATKLQLQCTAPDYASMVKPTQDLRDLAGQLPPWQDSQKLQSLSEADIGPVLLEYLRVYECALNERNNFKMIKIQQEKNGGNDFTNATEASREEGIIDHELAIARPALDRTLQIVGGADRLRPLALDIECLKRTSLDIRNILGLVSQVSACLPRVRDARGSLRDLPDLSASPAQ